MKRSKGKWKVQFKKYSINKKIAIRKLLISSLLIHLVSFFKSVTWFVENAYS